MITVFYENGYIILKHFVLRWFHGDITRKDAEDLLKNSNKGNGSFLVRTTKKGGLVMSFW